MSARTRRHSEVLTVDRAFADGSAALWSEARQRFDNVPARIAPLNGEAVGESSRGSRQGHDEQVADNVRRGRVGLVVLRLELSVRAPRIVASDPRWKMDREACDAARDQGFYRGRGVPGAGEADARLALRDRGGWAAAVLNASAHDLDRLRSLLTVAADLNDRDQ